jgi:hypothetical protein
MSPPGCPSVLLSPAPKAGPLPRDKAAFRITEGPHPMGGGLPFQQLRSSPLEVSL